MCKKRPLIVAGKIEQNTVQEYPEMQKLIKPNENLPIPTGRTHPNRTLVVVNV